MRSRLCVALFLPVLAIMLSAQMKPGLLSGEELKRAIPSGFYFEGQSAPVQMRNTAGFRVQGNQLVLAGLVDTSGYASDVAAKYQGFLIAGAKIQVGGSELSPGAYGFGFSKDGKFTVMDVGGNSILSVASQTEDKMTHPVPLKMTEDNGTYRLYAGKQWVSLSAR